MQDLEGPPSPTLPHWDKARLPTHLRRWFRGSFMSFCILKQQKNRWGRVSP